MSSNYAYSRNEGGVEWRPTLKSLADLTATLKRLRRRKCRLKPLSLLGQVAPVRQFSIKDAGRSRVLFLLMGPHFLPRILTVLGIFCRVS